MTKGTDNGVRQRVQTTVGSSTIQEFIFMWVVIMSFGYFAHNIIKIN